MNLTSYIKQQNGTATPSCPVLAGIATAAGCSAGTLYMIVQGHKRPSWKLAEAIERVTGKGVTRQDLRPDVFGPPVANEEAEAA